MSNIPLLTEDASVKEPPKIPVINKFVKGFSILFWCFIILKLFFFDIDVYLFNKFLPEYVNILNYKFVIGISLFALVLAIVRRRVVLLWTIYILLFPFIVVFWKVPYFIFKQKSWVLAVAVINSVIAFIVSIKYAIIFLAIFILSTVIIFNASNIYILYSSTFVILVALILIVLNRYIMIFKTSKVNRFYISFLSKPFNENVLKNITLDESLKELPYDQLNEQQLKTWVGNLQNTVMYNRLFLFMARKLKIYQESKLNYAFFAITTVFLLILTTLSFTLINMAIYKIDINAFRVSEAPSLFTFFYYSFNNLIFNAVDEMKPANTFAQSVSMIESFLALIMGLLFVGLLFSAKSERHARELDEVITKFEQRGSELEVFIREEYNIKSIEEALELLQQVQAVLIKFLYKITDNLK
ncbi:hypothetical protein [Terribacillus sp. DMT04]|uniref:hypothetical protein n=1 Tax=Terribacillus sp. DMT04 TaxID=2850441 RepID=UPI001C2C0C73|nr:hypothetical protein [Terribacillus sp. DMT04]QXE01920.1 hypothetical protein KS242_01265 [Terribacillus sp. DMT04]